ncbi:substrate-binding domain-containing protein [Micromonosporaceae bacterium Da 78-11]
MSRATYTKAAVVGAALALMVSACSSGKSDSAAPGGTAVAGKVSIAYLQKQGDQQYFIDEANGAKAAATELGIDLKVADLGNDADKTVSQVQTAIAQKASGVIIVVPDPALGPQVVQATTSAGVALLTSDDQICVDGPDPSKCPKDKLVPRIGFSGAQMGAEVGKRAAEEYTKAGWKPEDTAIVSAWKQDVTVCGDRVTAAKQAFSAGSGAQIRNIDVGTDNTPTGAQDRIAATVTANHAVKHWIVWGCNDENVSGAVTALQNAGYAAGDIIGVGLGAYLACKNWNSGKPTGFKAALFINGNDVGYLAVKTIYAKLKNGTAMPAEAFAPTKMVDAASWQQAGLKCS